jgi:hypothetical protein
MFEPSDKSKTIGQAAKTTDPATSGSTAIPSGQDVRVFQIGTDGRPWVQVESGGLKGRSFQIDWAGLWFPGTVKQAV